MFTRTRRRLTYLFTLPMGFILIAFTSVIYVRQVEEQISMFDKQLMSQTQRIAKMTQYRKEQGKWEIHRRRRDLTNGVEYICWYDTLGRLLQWNSYSSCPLKLSVSPGLRTIKSNKSNEFKLVPKAKFKRELTLRVTVDKKLIAYLQVAKSLKPLQEELKREQLFLSLGVPITFGFIGLVGWYLGGLAMQPTKRSYEHLLQQF